MRISPLRALRGSVGENEQTNIIWCLFDIKIQATATVSGRQVQVMVAQKGIHHKIKGLAADVISIKFTFA